ncbi:MULTISPECIES: DegV family protein [Candidatus Phytoplasma]|uniref:DegV family protein n=1 Tax='Catharanthus roseus' aster yellows phytoplasma TaxID=1193712 RepID=A0A4P6M8R2_9MOLU|nr:MULTISPECIES: DegV family protein [Phytoplasma]OIJ44618.1 fatty acid-binding protein DegV [Rice orange leaf phytoplasma]QBF23769.1 DegV family protein ['Catharanthus roseus' aster yellows phytoplasma]
MNKRKLGIVVDSTCGNTYGKNFFEDISVVPLTLIVGETSYMDGAIDNTTLLNFIENKQKVTTSQPNPELFIKAFKEQFDLGYKHVICLTLSSKLSGTHNSALLAKKMLNNPNITVIDTQNIGPGVYFFLQRINDWLTQNPDVCPQTITDKINEEKLKGFLLCTVNNLKILAYNGRISKFRFLIGNLLKIHPILKFQQGVLSIEKKVRNLKNCFNYCLKKILEHKTANNKLDIQVIYVDDDKDAKELLAQITNLANPQIKATLYGAISPVVAAHIGYKGFGFYLNEITD